MDQEELQNKIAEYYLKLPKKAQEVFAAQKWIETLRTISKRNSLSEGQTQILGTETTLILLGIISRDEYEEALAGELRLPREKFETILEEITVFILNPVFIELSDTYNKNKNVVVEEPQKEVSLDEKIESAGLMTQKLDTRFINLPAKIKEIISASNYTAKIYVLGKENGLTIAQISNLEGIVTDTILGTTSPQMFEVRAMSITGLNPDKLKSVINQINEKILKEIRRQIIELEKQEVRQTPTKEVKNTTLDVNDYLSSVVANNIPERITSEPTIVETPQVEIPKVSESQKVETYKVKEEEPEPAKVEIPVEIVAPETPELLQNIVPLKISGSVPNVEIEAPEIKTEIQNVVPNIEILAPETPELLQNIVPLKISGSVPSVEIEAPEILPKEEGQIFINIKAADEPIIAPVETPKSPEIKTNEIIDFTNTRALEITEKEPEPIKAEIPEMWEEEPETQKSDILEIPGPEPVETHEESKEELFIKGEEKLEIPEVEVKDVIEKEPEPKETEIISEPVIEPAEIPQSPEIPIASLEVIKEEEPEVAEEEEVIVDGEPLETNSAQSSGMRNTIAFQKLTKAFKNARTVTEYSLNNISKQTRDEDMFDSNLKVDPYRMPVE